MLEQHRALTTRMAGGLFYLPDSIGVLLGYLNAGPRDQRHHHHIPGSRAYTVCITLEGFLLVRLFLPTRDDAVLLDETSTARKVMGT